MNFRVAKFSDRKIILQMYVDGSNSLKIDGVDQWQGCEMPNLDNFSNLIKNKNIYVLEDKEPTCTAILLNYDKDYDNIYNGKWKSNGAYIVMHKVATLNKYKKQGYASKLFSEVFIFAKKSGFKSIRIDTHRDNLKMQSLIFKNGFTYCGVIYVDGKLERLCYEKILS